MISDSSPVELCLDGASAKYMGRQLYAVLAQLCDGEALDLVQNVVNSDGWEAWRVVSDEWSVSQLSATAVWQEVRLH